MDYKKYIEDSLMESSETKRIMSMSYAGKIEDVANSIVRSYEDGGKVIAFGNGGSAADAQHFVAELVGRYQMADRKPLAAIALNTNVSTLTAIGNDFGYEDIFCRQLLAFGQPLDVAVGISTSGNSQNIVKAIEVANKLGMYTVALTGEKGSKLSRIAGYTINVPSNNTPRIQEAHITAIHIICGLVEQKLYGGK